MQSTYPRLKSNQIPKYFLFLHKRFAIVGLVLIILSILVGYSLLIPFTLQPIIDLPINPYVFLLLVLLGTLYFIWYIMLLVLAHKSLAKFKINIPYKPATKIDLLKSALWTIFLFYLLLQDQINIFPDYYNLIRYVLIVIGFVYISVISIFFIAKNMPWFAKKDWEISDYSID